MNLFESLRQQGVDPQLLDGITQFRNTYLPEADDRIPEVRFTYYGKEVWEKAIAGILGGNHLLLSGPKATGKNVLSENLATLFGRPLWTISLNVNTDAASLIGSDTFKGGEVTLKKGPVYACGEAGGFGVFDEINMAKNEALSVVHSALDYRRILDVSGYGKLKLHPATRFIGTMNHGYIGTRDLNEALVSRFMVIHMPTITKENLELILKEKTRLNDEYIQRFSQFFLDIEKKSLNAEISSKAIDLRGLLNAIGLMEVGLPMVSAMEMGIMDKTFDSYEKELVMDVYATLFSKSLTAQDLFHA
ncbi:MoxR family ATPase [Peptoniphilus equinus]|uniref:MoxR family ATPase n=1 Tax=Peptoniphilus equinus TaxID=3016343 RepID=A0ABY7QX44_9FIRM|nr:MoxR family ATPase [Peptoniphilus equinus]WBW50503.1 MoxR family ATPase [Peptoniphilus equinus]